MVITILTKRNNSIRKICINLSFGPGTSLRGMFSTRKSREERIREERDMQLEKDKRIGETARKYIGKRICKYWKKIWKNDGII